MEDCYQVEAILQKRTMYGRNEYKIKWNGYSLEECTWEPEEHLSSCRGMLINFNNKTKIKNSLKRDQRLVNQCKSKGIKAKQTEGYFKEAKQLIINETRQVNHQKKVKLEFLDCSEKELMKDSTDWRQVNYYSPNLLTQQNHNYVGKTDQKIIQKKNKQIVVDCFLQEKRKNSGYNQNKTQILDMISDENGNIYFKIREALKQKIISRENLIKIDRISLIKFYENHILFVERQ